MTKINHIAYGTTPERPPDHQVESLMEQAATDGTVQEPEVRHKPMGAGNALAASALEQQVAYGPDRTGWKVCASQNACGITKSQPPENFYPNRGACKKCKRAADEARKRGYREQCKTLTKTLYYCPDCNTGIAHKGTPNGKNISAFCRPHLSLRRSRGATKQKTEFWANKREKEMDKIEKECLACHVEPGHILQLNVDGNCFECGRHVSAAEIAGLYGETIATKYQERPPWESLDPSPYDLTWLFADEPVLQQELEADAKLNYRTSAMQLAWIVKQRYTFTGASLATFGTSLNVKDR